MTWRDMTRSMRSVREREGRGGGGGGGGSEGAARMVPGVECFSGRQILV
jgi:hypothetical protein